MKQEEKNLPLSQVSLVFGGLSIALAFVRHLVSLALVLSVLSLAFGLWGQRKQARHLLRYTKASVQRGGLGVKLGAVGLLCSLMMWGLWASNALF
ncbi:MAG: hypothetical protein E6Q44_13855 [Flavobacteriales bacterium]|jgi:uncharacterized membrane protein YccF (DUF307 family)|nr:MAG: hypothetical protein E6Q44_13855 [Flavobacteriales bacterium]